MQLGSISKLMINDLSVFYHNEEIHIFE